MDTSDLILHGDCAGYGPREGLLERAARHLVYKRLECLERGGLVVRAGHKLSRFGSSKAGPQPALELRVHDAAFFCRLVAGGSNGAAKSWIRGEWSCSDLTALIRLLLRNDGTLHDMERGLPTLVAWAERIRLRLDRNTPSGSRRNISAHYDLGNDFFELLLDPTLTYSAGVFERPQASMEEASRAKYERLCRKLEIGPGDRVLEIGSGWGGFAIHAASTRGCHVTTATISQQQHLLASQRMHEHGLDDRVEVLFEDYRALRGRFDKLVSIEMIEAVGAEYLETFFRVCSDRLEPDGAAGLQAITIRDELYEVALRTVDFIKLYIFPGGFIPSMQAILRATHAATDLHLVHSEDLTAHYAETLRRWRSRMYENLGAMRELGCSDEFLRMWEFYLCYCEAGFEEGRIGSTQLVFAKPLSQLAPQVAPLPVRGC